MINYLKKTFLVHNSMWSQFPGADGVYKVIYQIEYRGFMCGRKSLFNSKEPSLHNILVDTFALHKKHLLGIFTLSK